MKSAMLALRGDAETVSLQLSFCGINMTRGEVADLFGYLATHKSVLGTGESLESKRLYSSLKKGRKGRTSYFAALKPETFALAVWLCGKLGEKTEELISNLLFIPRERIRITDERSGETCIVKEAVLKNGRCASRGMLAANDGLCVNTDLNCKYKDGDKCFCTKSDADGIISALLRKNILCDDSENFRLNI